MEGLHYLVYICFDRMKYVYKLERVNAEAGVFISPLQKNRTFHHIKEHSSHNAMYYCRAQTLSGYLHWMHLMSKNIVCWYEMTWWAGILLCWEWIASRFIYFQGSPGFRFYDIHSVVSMSHELITVIQWYTDWYIDYKNDLFIRISFWYILIVIGILGIILLVLYLYSLMSLIYIG